MEVEQIKEIIREARPNITQSTLKVYSMNLKKILNGNDKKVLKDKDYVFKFLDEKSMNTKRNYLNAVIVFLQTFNDKSLKPIIRHYETIRDDYNKKYLDNNNDNNISESQKKNLPKWNEILDVVKKIKTLVKEKNLEKKDYDDFKRSEHLLYTTYILLELYTKLPPLRNDYAQMNVLMKSDFNKLKYTERQENNYLVYNNKTFMKMYINNYKTKGSYEEVEIEVPRDLRLILKKYINHFKLRNQYLLLDYNKTPITRNQITKLLTDVFQRELNKNVSTTLLRKSYVSFKYNKMTTEQKKDAQTMMHSVEVQNKIYNKNIE